ncbi:HTR1A [Branchiostoma lanceolatum]|uniref:HTR1A protein n=1 Tax=Branchiostoma lanceolatum TaxID=7740 RepID=A0A8J9ZZP4_BRALA|nr:HTR1A [Branchiostoma lanceolatum]
MSSNNTTARFNVTNATTEFDWEPYFYASSPYGEVQLVYLGASLLLAVGGNTAVLLTVLLTEDLRTPGNFLLCALAASDILQAVTKVPLAMYFLVIRESLACDAFQVALSAIYMFFTIFSICIIIPISLDRYWFICSPLRYPNIMTKTRTALLTGVAALLTSITVLPPLIEGGRDSFFPTYFMCRYEGPARLIRQALMNTCLTVTLVTMFFCYYRIWREVRRQQAVIRHLQPAPLADRTQGTTGGQTQDTTADQSGDESAPADLGEVWAYPRHAHVNLGLQLDDEAGASEQPPVQDDPEHNAVAQPSAQPDPVAQEPGRPLLSPEFRQRLRTVGTVTMVVAVFWVSWIPYSVTIFRMGTVGVEEAAPTDGLWQRLAIIVSMISTYSNPIIYAYRNRELRQAFLRLCRHR